jgi:hypothetical protein
LIFRFQHFCDVKLIYWVTCRNLVKCHFRWNIFQGIQ